MITYVKKTEAHPSAKDIEENRFEQIRKAAAERHRKLDTDGTRRRERETVEKNRLI